MSVPLHNLVKALNDDGSEKGVTVKDIHAKEAEAIERVSSDNKTVNKSNFIDLSPAFKPLA